VTSTLTRVSEPSASSAAFSRSAAFSTLAERSGPERSWRDQSSSVTSSAATCGAIDPASAATLTSNAESFTLLMTFSLCHA
jgi:hypothetical protein